jgi:hypothetical protein
MASPHESLTPESLVWRQGDRNIAAGPSRLHVTRDRTTTGHPPVSDAPLMLRHPTTSRPLRVVGLGARLGDWQPESGIPFTQDGRALAASPLLSLGGVYEFKLVAGDAPGPLTWEPGANRYLLHDGAPVDVAWQPR